VKGHITEKNMIYKNANAEEEILTVMGRQCLTNGNKVCRKFCEGDCERQYTGADPHQSVGA
jgi:hypothetical protein